MVCCASFLWHLSLSAGVKVPFFFTRLGRPGVCCRLGGLPFDMLTPFPALFRLHVGLTSVQETLFDKQVHRCYRPAWCFFGENRNLVVSDSVSGLRFLPCTGYV